MESLLQKQQQASVSDHTTDGTKGKESKIDTPIIETPPGKIQKAKTKKQSIVYMIAYME
jgi:hypothetical protein